MSASGAVLGFASSVWSSSSGSWDDTHVGGLAIWPASLRDRDMRPPRCPRCAAQRVLVLQAFAPLRVRPQRAIHLYACNSIACAAHAESWWAVRVCRVADDAPRDNKQAETAHAQPASAQAPVAGDINWDTDEEDAASDESNDLAENLALLSFEVDKSAARKDVRALSFARQPASSSRAPPNKPKRAPRGAQVADDAVQQSAPAPPADPSFRPACTAYYVAVDYEPPLASTAAPDDHDDDPSVHALLQNYLQEERDRASAGVPEAWAPEKEDPQSSAQRHRDNFQDTVARAPAQILRYNYGGQPLWPEYPPPKIDPDARCDCGAPLVFELQVLATCLHYLKPDLAVPDHQHEAGMNFASVAIFTCAEDCTNVDSIAENGFFKVISQTVCIQQDDW